MTQIRGLQAMKTSRVNAHIKVSNSEFTKISYNDKNIYIKMILDNETC